MIQDTTLRMVVQAIDRASAPLDAVKARVEQLDTSMETAGRTAEDALPAIGKEAVDLADNMDDLGRSAAGTASVFSSVWAEAAVIAGVAFIQLYKYIEEANKKHQELQDKAHALNLPFDTVKKYSEAWLDVAMSLNEVARGYARMSDAQSAAFKALGMSPGNAVENERIQRLISLGQGTDIEKSDALRRIFSDQIKSDEKALEIIRANQKQFLEEKKRLGLSDESIARLLAGDDRGLAPGMADRVRNLYGQNAPGQLNVGQLLNSGRLPTPQGFENKQFADKAIEDMEKSIQRTMDAAARNRADAQKDSAKAEQQIIRDNYDQQQDIVKQGLKIREQEEKALAAVIKENDKQIEKAGKDAWSNVNDETRARLKEMEVPVNEFVETWKDAMKDMVFFGDFSFKRLVARIIVQLTSKELFAAIDRIGDSLSNAMSGGGGLLGGVKSFFGSIFGNAGGGQESGLRWVGEEGPELVASGPNAMRVYNMRQMAFAGGGPGGAKQTIHYHDNRNYSISGVETQQVFGYIEQTRREDQRGIVRMLERNGLGSMR